MLNLWFQTNNVVKRKQTYWFRIRVLGVHYFMFNFVIRLGYKGTLGEDSSCRLKAK